MKYFFLPTRNPYRNLATEEYMLLEERDDIFMLWQNEPVVVIGKNQNAYVEIDLEYTRRNGIKIARRITGGGAVYHDLGNVNYTFITSHEKAAALDYAYFTRPIIDALKTLGIHAELSGRNDLVCDGKKFSGNAQYASATRILHHGTLLFDSDLEVLSRTLTVDKEKIESKAVSSVKSRVTNLKPLMAEQTDVGGFIRLLEEFALKEMNAVKTPPLENEKIDRLEEKYSSPSFIFSDKKYLTAYTMTKKKRFPFGIVQVMLNMDREVITELRVSGDFFGIRDVEELEEFAKGKRIDEIADFPYGNYISGMTGEEFVNLLKS